MNTIFVEDMKPGQVGHAVGFPKLIVLRLPEDKAVYIQTIKGEKSFDRLRSVSEFGLRYVIVDEL